MNCTYCNTPIVPEARFCKNCGFPVSTDITQPTIGNDWQASQQGVEDSPTILPPPWQVQKPESIEPPFTQPAYQPTVAVSSHPGSMPSRVTQPTSPPPPMRRRKNRLTQVLLILLITLFILALILAGGWFFALRPYLHGAAQNEVDGAFATAINLINPLEVDAVASSHTPVIITEKDANNFIDSNNSQSTPVQQLHMSITRGGLRLDFQTYGLTSTITGVPQVANGQIVITDVKIQGIAALIMSPDELTNEANADLQQVSARLHRPITRVALKNHEMDIQLA